MSAQFSPVIAAQPRPLPGFSTLQFIDLDALGVANSPVAVLDDFRVPGLPFSPHPHAGFAAVTYVFEDSAGAVRSRASSGINLLIGPGGIIGTHAGSAIVHEEIPAEPGRELHGIQIFVNLSARNKLTAPQVLYLEPSQVPEWRSEAADRVRVVVGSSAGVSSPLDPAEPFTLLDAQLRRDISFVPAADADTVIYVPTGSLRARAGVQEQKVDADHTLALYASGGQVTFQGPRTRALPHLVRGGNP